MPINKFNRLVAIIVITSALVAAIISVVVYTRGPRVRQVAFEGNIASSFLSDNQVLTLRFDRSINQTDYTDAITITPELAVDVTANKQALVVTLNESLRADTEYTLTVAPKVTDTTGRQMQESYTYSFATGAAQYMYLQRNYGFSPELYEDDLDHVIRSSVGSDAEEIIYSAPKIRSFAANSQYAVVASAEDGQSDQLAVIDLNTLEAIEPELYIGGAVGNLTIAERGGIATFTSQPNGDIQSVRTPEDYYRSTVRTLDLVTLTLNTLTDVDGDPLSAFELSLTSDGQVVLVRDDTSNYLAVSPYNDYEPVFIGAHTDDFGFNSDESQILFIDGDQVQSYDLLDSQLTQRNIEGDGFLNDIDYSTNDLFASFSSDDYDPQTESFSTMSQIVGADDWRSEAVVVWQEPQANGRSLDEFRPSYGSNYLALQTRPDGCQFDDFTINIACIDTTTEIFDITTQETIVELNGFDLVWLP